MNPKYHKTPVCLLSSLLLSSPLSAVTVERGNRAIIELPAMVVQAEHLERPIWETPNSISLFSADILEERHVTNLQDLIKITPGVTQNFGGEGLTIRGIAQNGVGAGGRLQAITTTVDGVYQPRFNNRIDPFNFFDISQVEIVRGGQSAFQGRSALAGAVVIRSNDPVFNREGQIETSFQEGSRFGAAALFNEAISESFAVRISGGYTDGDGFIKNINLDEDADPEQHQWGRVKLLYQPEHNSAFRALATFYHSDIETGDDFVDASLGIENREITSNLAGSEDNTTNALTLELEHDDGGSFSYGATFTYGDFDYMRFDDDDRTAGGGISSRTRNELTEQYTADFNIRYMDGEQTAVFGLFAFRNDIDETFGGVIDFAALSPAVGAFYPGGFFVDTAFATPSESENYALYAEYERTINEDWSFRLGLRYDYERFDFTSGQNISALTAFNGANPGVDGFIGSLLGESVDSDDTNFGVFLPSASITRHFGEKLNTSLSYRRDYRGGGVDIDLANLTTTQYDAEFTDTFEYAIRAFDLFDGSYDTSLNVYYTQWQDQQVFAADATGIGTTTNAGDSELYGIEWSQNWRPLEHLELYTSLAYNKTKFIDFVTVEDNPATPADEEVNFDGNAFPNAPEISVTVGATFRFANGVTADINANYQDESYVDTANTLKNEERVLVNASIGYDTGDWYLQTFVSNLFDKTYITNNANDGIVKVGDPRILGIRAGMRF